jgi:hypothetical protein
MAFGGSSSETQSHPIDMVININRYPMLDNLFLIVYTCFVAILMSCNKKTNIWWGIKPSTIISRMIYCNSY